MSGLISLSGETAASVTVAFSQASLATRCGALLLEPSARRDEAGKRLRELRDQRLPGRRRQVVAHEHGLANGGEMAEAGDDAVERERHDLGERVLDQDETGLGRTDLGDGGGHRARKLRAVGDRGLRLRRAGRDRVDEIGVEQKRRVLQHPGRDLGLVGGEAEDHRRRRLLAEGQRTRQLGANERRRIVEQHDERALGSGAVIRREIGIEIGAGERGGGVSPLGGWCSTHPLEELTNDHDATDATMSSLSYASAPLRRVIPKPSARALTKRSP